MAARAVGFSPTDARRIAAVVRDFERRLRVVEQQLGTRPGATLRASITGLLTSELTRGGTATLAVSTVDSAGGLGDATEEEYDIVDAGMLADDSSPLPVGIVCTAIWCDGVWLLVSYDCDLEDVS